MQKRSEFIYYDAKQPYMQQWHVKFQRELRAGLVAEVGYNGSKGHNLPFYGDPNSVPAEYLPDGTKRTVPGAALRYPSWGRIRTRINIARSNYHGLIASLNKRFSNGFLFQASYTLGDSKDTWSGGQIGGADFDNGYGSATDWWDPEAEYGPSNFDVRHTFVFNAVYQLPWGRSLTGVAGGFLKGWQLGGILQMSSGLPFTPIIGFDRAGDLQSDTTQQKPNVIKEVTYPKTTDMWYDVTAFALPAAGTFGNAKRNSLRGPGVKLTDLTLSKNLQTGRFTTQIRLEAFNAFNWVNLGNPSAGSMFTTSGALRAGTGRITSTSTRARQVQLGVKLMF